MELSGAVSSMIDVEEETQLFDEPPSALVHDEFAEAHMLTPAGELGARAGASQAHALQALELLKLQPLLAIISAARGIMSNPRNLRALGFPPQAASQAADDSRTFELRLDNLRLSTRIAPRMEADPEDQPGTDVCKVSLLIRETTAPGKRTFGHDPSTVRREIACRAGAERRDAPQPPDLTREDIQRVADELSMRLSVAPSQARKRLEQLGAALLIEELKSARHIIADRRAMCRLGLSADAVLQAAHQSARFEFKLDNLSPATRKGALVGGPAFLHQPMLSTRHEMLKTSRPILALTDSMPNG